MAREKMISYEKYLLESDLTRNNFNDTFLKYEFLSFFHLFINYFKIEFVFIFHSGKSYYQDNVKPTKE